MDNVCLPEGKNTGVIIGPEVIRSTDFRVGAESGLAFEARNPSGDWEKYRPTDEWQRYFLNSILGYDTLSCVTFSALRIVAMQVEWMIETNALPPVTVEWLKAQGYIDENGKVNFNEHFTAVMSGTSMNGNSLQAVWDSIRRDGLLPQKDGPAVNDFTTTQAWLANTITQAQKDKAALWLNFFDEAYEWVVLNQPGRWDLFELHVKQAPLHIATPTCASWNNPAGTLVTGCGDYKDLNHATSYIAQVKQGASIQYHKDLDHYNPFIKMLAPDYYMPYALKGVVYAKGAAPKPQPPATFDIRTYVFKVNLKAGAPDSDEVRRLQLALQTIKSHGTGKPYMTPGNFGPYGPATQAAVALLQAEHGILTDGGKNFGPSTRGIVNNALAALPANS